MKLNLPKDLIINIINYNRYLHKQNIKKVIKYNKILKKIPKINDAGISKPYIIIYPNKIFNNKKLIKFIYKLKKKNIIAYSFVDINIMCKDLIKLYKI